MRMTRPGRSGRMLGVELVVRESSGSARNRLLDSG